MQSTSRRVADSLARHGIAPGQSVAILSANDPTSFTCVFGISRAGAVWCPINPRNEAAENRELLDLFDCTALLFQASFAPLVEAIAPHLPKLTLLVCLDGEADGALSWTDFLDGPGRSSSVIHGPNPVAESGVCRPGDDRRHRRHDRHARRA